MLTFPNKFKKAHPILILYGLVCIMVLFTLIQDFLRSSLNHSSFYLSEAFLFSSYWWLYAPLLYGQFYVLKHNLTKSIWIIWSCIFTAIITHLLLFPFLVWLLSTVFYYHSFRFGQTLRYALSEHLYQLALVYSLPILAYKFVKDKLVTKAEHIVNIIVDDGARKLSLPVTDILYFSASYPYASVHCSGKRYLCNETLKSLSGKLAPGQFIRVHKSTIVNIACVTSYRTRHNGDYDLFMANGESLRLSRNFAVAFKDLFTKGHRVTPK